MAIYQYPVNSKRAKLYDLITIITISAYFALPVMVFFGDKSKLPPALLQRIIPLMIILGIMMFLMPFIQLTKRKRNQGLKIESGRKGLTIKLFESKNTYSWKDLSRSVIIYDTHQDKIFTRKVILRHGSGSTPIDNPPEEDGLENLEGLVKELTDNLPGIKQQVIGIPDLCPWCGIYKNTKKCPKCEGNIEYIPKIHKIFYYIKINILLAAIAAMMMGKAFFIPGLILFILFAALPLLFILRQDKHINHTSPQDSAKRNIKK